MAGSFCLQAQEICDNGIDDNGNGLIDMNDFACQCRMVPLYPVDLIVNPSAETTYGLPGPLYLKDGYLNGWFQTGRPTTFYLHESSDFFMAYEFGRGLMPSVPRPIPDGKGIIALIDSMPQDARSGPPFRSYASMCLGQTLKPDTLYNLTFSLGNGLRQGGSGDFLSTVDNTIALYGIADCKVGAKEGTICPTENGWTQLGEVKISVAPTHWEKISIDFQVPHEMAALAVGTSCYKTLDFVKSMYFVDAFQLSQGSMPALTIERTKANYCKGENGFVDLGFKFADLFKGSSLIWYKNGAALPEENGAGIHITETRYGPGIYQIRVKNDSICLLSDTIRVDFVDRLKIDLGPKDTLMCETETLKLEINPKGGKFNWSTGSTGISINVYSPGTYSVTGVNACAIVEDDIIVRYRKCVYDIQIPSAFSPNNDGKNDLFKIRYNLLPRKFNLTIYNRYGQKVFETTDASTPWDGKRGVTPMPEGHYVYIMELTDFQRKTTRTTGSIMLIR